MILQRGYDNEEDTTTTEIFGPYNSTINYKRRDTTTTEDTTRIRQRRGYDNDGDERRGYDDDEDTVRYDDEDTTNTFSNLTI